MSKIFGGKIRKKQEIIQQPHLKYRHHLFCLLFLAQKENK